MTLRRGTPIYGRTAPFFVFKKILRTNRKEDSSKRRNPQIYLKGTSNMSKNESATEQAVFQTVEKFDIGFQMHDKHVVGVCLLHQSRQSQENARMTREIREESIVIIGNQDISDCVQRAKDLAYQSAVSRLEAVGNIVPAMPLETAPYTPQAAPNLGTVATDQIRDDNPISENAGVIKQKDKDEQPLARSSAPGIEPEEENPGADEGADRDDGSESDMPTGEVKEPNYAAQDFGDTGDEDDENPAQNNGIQRLDLNLGLQPAANLLHNAPAAQKANQEEAPDLAMKKALEMPITILGKLHSSYGKTAGEILNSDPQCIVDFAHRYTGPKVEEKESLVLLYPEAVRRVQAAA